MTTKKPITAVRVEREPEPPGPVFHVEAVDGLATAEVRGRDSEQLAALLKAAPELQALCVELSAALVQAVTAGVGPTPEAEALLNRARETVVSSGGEFTPPRRPDPSVRQLWEWAARDLRDAAARLVVLQESVGAQINDTVNPAEVKERDADAAPIADLELPRVLEIAEAASGCFMPDWVDWAGGWGGW